MMLALTLTVAQIAHGREVARVIASLHQIDRSPAARASLHRLVGLDADVVVPGHGPAYRGTPDAAVRQALVTG